MACANAVAPLQLPIANFSVTPDGFGFTRGVQLGIGTPQQIVSLVPGMSDVNTYVWNSAVCAPSNNSCLAGRGGVFNPQLSSSFAETRASEWNGSRFNGNEAQFIYFNDGKINPNLVTVCSDIVEVYSGSYWLLVVPKSY